MALTSARLRRGGLVAGALALLAIVVWLESASGGQPQTYRAHLRAQGSSTCLHQDLSRASEGRVSNMNRQSTPDPSCIRTPIRYAFGRDTAGLTLEATFEASALTPSCASHVEASVRSKFQDYFDCSEAEASAWSAQCEKFVPGKGFVACAPIAGAK